MLDTQNGEYLHALSQSQEELEKLKEVKERLAAEKRTEDRHFQYKDRRKAIG